MKTVSRQKFSRVFKPFLYLLAVCLCVGLATGASAALGIDLKKIPKLGERTMLPQAEFEKMTRLEKEPSPYGDAYLPYEIRLPKGWTKNVQEGTGALKTEDKKLGVSVLSLLGRYVGPPKNLMRSHLTVEAQILSYEVSVKNWFVNFILKNGFSLSALSEISDKEIEAVYVQMEKDQTYAVHVRVMINGSRLIMVRYYLPQDNFQDEKAMQAQVVKSFTLTAPSSERIEKQLEYGFLDQSYLNYPASWKINTKSIYSIERMSAQLYQEIEGSQPNTLDGQIRIDVISRLLNTTLSKEVQNFRKNIAIPGYSIGKLIDSIPYKYDDSIKSGKAQAYELTPASKATMKPYEFVVTVMEGADFYYITSLITPARDIEPYIWARNMESLKIVNESLRRNNVKIDPNDPYYDYLKE